MNDAKTILIAEDDANDLDLILSALEEHKLANRVQVVRDGAQALDYLFRRGQFASRGPGNPAVVLLDLKMPKVNGHEVLEQIRTTGQLKRIPVVMFTSSREPCDVERSYDLGANAYVVKAFSFTEFTDAVRKVGDFWTVLNEVPSSS